jgi:hypothetical protein
VLGAILLAAAWAGRANAQIGSSGSTVGYIDTALPLDMVRLRFDAAYNINRSDRAEYIYSPGFDPHIDYQNASTYLEMLLTPDLSGFAELNAHFVNPLDFKDASGLGDSAVGFKWAFLRTDDQVVTFQLRTYVPTGNPDRTLGNGHVSLEPALLYYQPLTDRLTLEAEFRDWTAVGATSSGGSILRYGAGLGYSAIQNEQVRVAPVVELVGWTALSGKESIAPGVFKDAAGDEIINAKVGLRVSSDRYGDIYVGYGRSLTGAVWYKNLASVEYRLRF